MSVLIANEQADFLFLKEHLKATDGNLASHTNSLEKLGYLSIEKKFVGKKPKTIFHLTEEGRKAFTDHLNALEELIKNPYK
ncbi:transcriptional regulator [Sediminitomix flava]|uniref:Transcriptional regulator n=2 Tax=Sediminitomix flava TaxID=379075 RepID=A0A315Z7H9_SEDFL|nr:transcriptional regulator [Sediminitomix flava]